MKYSLSKQQLEQLNTLVNKITSHPTAIDVIEIKDLMKEINSQKVLT